jgi:1-acyl-sn-glycerol-3-phosphate acyltransferase
VATLISRSDRARIEAQVFGIFRDLLRELGNPAASATLQASTSLDNDLGLGSIERVELLSRLERNLGMSIPEIAIAEAETVEDVIVALAGAQGNGSTDTVEEPPAKQLSDREKNPDATDSRSSPAISEARTQNDATAQAIRGERQFFWRVLEAIYGFYAATVFLGWLVLTWLILLLMPRGRTAARMTSVALRLYFRLVGCRIVLEGREHMDAYGACIYVSNHTSYSDVLVVMALFETNYHFVAKNEINDMPFIGTFLRRLGHFAFERGKLRARSRLAEQMEQALLRGESLFVFAEGTFTAQPGVRPFQSGAFRAAVKTGRPIVPVALRGARRFLQDGTFLPKPSRITVTVCPALVPSAAPNGRDLAEVLRLRDEARRIISSHSGEPLIQTYES